MSPLFILFSSGVIQLLADTQVCKKGDTLTPEQCRILELFDIKMAEFRIAVDCVWENGEFERLATDSLVHTHPCSHTFRSSLLRGRRAKNDVSGGG